MESANYYDILGIDTSANESEIRRAYFEKAKLYHPDSYQGNPEEFEQVKLAYQELLTPLRRASYDKELGLQHNFGSSQLAEEFDNYRMQSEGSLNFKSRNKANIFSKFFKLIGQFLKNKIVQETPVRADKSVSMEIEKSITISLAIYDEDSFPLGIGESLTLKTPDSQQELTDCTDLLRKSLKRHPIIERAILIEASLATLPSQKVFLVFLTKQISRTWGIDSLQTLEIENYPEHLPGLLLCSAGESPFSEAVNLYGVEFYPSSTENNIIN